MRSKKNAPRRFDIYYNINETSHSRWLVGLSIHPSLRAIYVYPLLKPIARKTVLLRKLVWLVLDNLNSRFAACSSKTNKLIIILVFNGVVAHTAFEYPISGTKTWLSLEKCLETLLELKSQYILLSTRVSFASSQFFCYFSLVCNSQLVHKWFCWRWTLFFW